MLCTSPGIITNCSSPPRLYERAARSLSLSLSFHILSAKAYSCILHCAWWKRYGFGILSSTSVEAVLQHKWFWITEEHIVPTPNLFCAHGRSQLTTTEKVLFLRRCGLQRIQKAHACWEERTTLWVAAWKKKIHFEPPLTTKTKEKTTKALLRFWFVFTSPVFQLFCVILKVITLTLCSGGTSVTTPIPQMRVILLHLNFKHLIKAFVWHGLKIQSQVL